MNILDGIILACFIGGVVLGYIRGFIRQLISMIGFIASLVAAMVFYDDLSPWVAKIIPLSSWEAIEPYEPMIRIMQWDTYFYNAIAFALIFFGAKFTLSIAGHFLNIIAKVPIIHALNKWSGALLGCLEAVLLVIVAVNVMRIVPAERVQYLLAESYILNMLNEYIPFIAEKLHELWNQ